ncbi:hypothetical protein diail_977 [Diaporthe ilicicola]|nr:hypothetical protein diail_977 [Diaporthe ilicicola]
MDEDGMQHHVDNAGQSDEARYSWNPARARSHVPNAQPPTRIRTDMNSAALGDSVDNDFMMPDLAHPYWSPDSATDGAGRVTVGTSSGGLASEAGLRPAVRPDRLPPGSRQSHTYPNAGSMAPAGGLAHPPGWNAQQQTGHYARQQAPSYPSVPNVSQKTPSGAHREDCAGSCAQGIHTAHHSQSEDARQHPRAAAQPPKSAPMPLPSPVSVRSPCSDVLRDHGLDIDEVLSGLESQRRCSVPPPQPRVSLDKVAHGRVRKSEYVFFDKPRHSRDHPQRQAAPDDPVDVGAAEDQHDQQHREWRPRVKKIVVIYMGEESGG